LKEDAFDTILFGCLFVSFMYGYLLVADSLTTPLLNGYLFTSRYVLAIKLFVILCGVFIFFSAKTYILIGANHLMSAFLALVGFGLNMYALIMFDGATRVAREAAIKYFYLSTISTGLILYGMFMLYVLTGSGEFDDIYVMLAQLPTNDHIVLVNFSLALIFVGFMFKLSAFPGHL